MTRLEGVAPRHGVSGHALKRDPLFVKFEI